MMTSTSPSHIYYTLYEPDQTATKAAILLLHGMQEHSGRYRNLANYLKDRGYAVLTYDQTGHGHTATSKKQLGFFRKSRPGDLLVEEAEQMAYLLSQRVPAVPLILMGHSMGSFVARLLLKKVPGLFAGTILVGTGGPNPMAILIRPLLYLANAFLPEKRSKWLNRLFSTVNNHQFKHERPNDGTNWLSTSLENREAFQKDELCGVDFSNNAFFGLISLNTKATQATWAEHIPRKMPMLLISGAEDPIGNFGKGVKKTVNGLQKQGFERVEIKIYPGMRHEILNEDNRIQVFQDVFEWLEEVDKRVKPAS